MYSCIPTCCCACCCVVCCYTAVAAAAACCLLLLAAAVRHRVPDGKICCCGSLRLTPVFSFSSFKHDFFSMYPLTVLSHFQRRFFTYNACNTSSVLRTCAEARRALARRGGAPLVLLYYYQYQIRLKGCGVLSCYMVTASYCSVWNICRCKRLRRPPLHTLGSSLNSQAWASSASQ